MLEILLLIFYFALFTILLGWQLKRTNSVPPTINLPKYWWFAALWLHLLGALSYGLIHWYFLNKADTFQYFIEGKRIFSLLETHPSGFWRMLLGPNAQTTSDPVLNQLLPEISSWSDARSYMMVRLVAAFYFFAGGSYIVMGLFWGAISFWALRLFYHIFALYTQYKLFFVTLFLSPSIAFWGAGLHKDALTIASICCIVSGCHLLFFKSHYPKTKAIILLLIGCIGQWLIRNYVLPFVLLPCLLMVFTIKWPQKQTIIFVLVYGFGFALLLLTANSQHPLALKIWKELRFLQWYFVVYNHGNADIAVNLMQQNPLQLLGNSFAALLNAGLRPLWNDIKNPFALIAFFETVLLLAIGIYRGIAGNYAPLKNLGLLSLFFVVSYLWFIGLINDNIGTTIRYKVVVMPFLVALLWWAPPNLSGLNETK
ncbi:MAG: hypothetical protein IPI59_10055 [Sphingobacteriales bacterium]|jgi:hypothetical protein|nr:hypothetical protein [Sphingobacteriales bacterium]MBP9142051.1 hypothetical protein [Chitinophagales bacterium]MDA0198169.1 hypothetical protein [Bacteroidota bacterium]MBK6889615.1 hypothetical protein [Sphingobacteriales bacterium]MBK7527874.1 hypothetical protein [Sphingobacteriales bacterium]